MSFSFITGIQQTSLIICGSVSTAYQESQIHIDYAPFTSGTWTAWSHLEESSHKFLFGLRWDDATPLACTNGSLAITSPAVCQYSNHGGACNQPGKYCKQQMLLTISNTFPSTNSGQIQLEGTFKNTSPTTFSATLVLHNPSMSTNLSSLNSARKLLYTSSHVLDTYHPNDVLFRFKDGRCLWATSEIVSASPWINGLLTGGFEESVKRPYSSLTTLLGRANLTEAAELDPSNGDVEDAKSVEINDSDEEENCGNDVQEGVSQPHLSGDVDARDPATGTETCSTEENSGRKTFHENVGSLKIVSDFEERSEVGADSVDLARTEDSKTNLASDNCTTLVRVILPVSGSYKTYRAVLLWIYSFQIKFAPLKSSLRYATTARAMSVRNAAQKSFLNPSPKSVYRLAKHLELPKLSELALGEIRRQITSENVAYELYSDLAKMDPDVKYICLKVASSNWQQVKVSQAMKDLQQDWLHGRRVKDADISFALAEMF